MSSSALVSIPTNCLPRVKNCARATHGHILIERYFTRGVWHLHAYQYEAELTVNGHNYVIRPGWISLFPPDSKVEFRFHRHARHTHTYAAFLFPKKKKLVRIPLMTDLRANFAEFLHQFSEMTRWCLPRRQFRADICLADLLGKIVDFHQTMHSQTGNRNSVVEASVAYIEEHLAEPLTVPLIARNVGISHNHLLRLFRRVLGQTIVAYIRSRRALRAQHLLEQTTLPMKSLASMVGVADAQSFNKLVRRELGISPRECKNNGCYNQVGSVLTTS